MIAPGVAHLTQVQKSGPNFETVKTVETAARCPRLFCTSRMNHGAVSNPLFHSLARPEFVAGWLLASASRRGRSVIDDMKCPALRGYPGVGFWLLFEHGGSRLPTDPSLSSLVHLPGGYTTMADTDDFPHTLNSCAKLSMAKKPANIMGNLVSSKRC